jgi:uncharacterized protein with GYD domain
MGRENSKRAVSQQHASPSRIDQSGVAFVADYRQHGNYDMVNTDAHR